MVSQIYNYYYLDIKGIDMLFAQSGKPYVEQVIRKKSKETKGALDAKFGVGSLVKALGLGETEFKGNLSKEIAGSEEFSELLRTEHKLKIVLDSLKENKKLFLINRKLLDYIKSKGRILGLKERQFVEFEGHFKVPNIKPDNIAIMSQEASAYEKSPHVYNSFVIFESDMGKPIVKMGTSLAKYTTGLHHLMVIWEGGNVNLRVFGELTITTNIKNEKHFWYLKPFSIRHA